MNKRRAIIPWIAGLAALLLVSAADAAPELYDDAELSADTGRLAARTEFLLESGLRDFMTAEERLATDGVEVVHPLRGAGPLAFKFVPIAGEAPVIVAPAATLRFVEDLSTAYAFRALHRLSLEPVDEYLAMLKHRPERFPGARPPPPLPALGVPPRIWETDKAVDDLSLRFRNTAWAFLLAHELGHLRLGHAERPASAADSQSREEAADAFAVDLLSRSDTIPMGAILWLQASAGYQPSRADFASDAAYENWLRTEASHPVNGARLRHLGRLMRDEARRAADPNAAETLDFIAARLEAIGAIVEDPEMQSYLRRCADTRAPEDLTRREDRACR